MNHPTFYCIGAVTTCFEHTESASQLCAEHAELDAKLCDERHPITGNRCCGARGHLGGHRSRFKPPGDGMFAWSWKSAIRKRSQVKRGRR